MTLLHATRPRGALSNARPSRPRSASKALESFRLIAARIHPQVDAGCDHAACRQASRCAVISVLLGFEHRDACVMIHHQFTQSADLGMYGADLPVAGLRGGDVIE